MSRSLRAWLQARALADMPGCAKMEQVPYYNSGSRVQVIHFLTYRPEDAPHTAIDVWAQVCDAEHYIPARFTSACVDAFQAEMPGVRFTQARGAIFAIRSCRVVFAQVPVQSTPWRKSTPTEPVLEVEQCTLLGGIGELVHTDALRNVLY